MKRLIETVGGLAVYPAVVAHELTHLVVAGKRFRADVVQLRYPDPHVAGSWDGDTPVWRYVVANLAPTLVGVVCIAVIGLLVIGGVIPVPESLFGRLATGVFAVNMAIYTWPSKDDRTLPVAIRSRPSQSH